MDGAIGSKAFTSSLNAETGLEFEDLVTVVAQPPNRVGKSDGSSEHHLYEGAVMLAYAMHLLRTQGAQEVLIHPPHPDQVSRLYRDFCETAGLLIATPSRSRQVAVVPLTESTVRLAERLAPRCALTGIEIALVSSRGEVMDVKSAAAAHAVSERNH